jgi:hypothetical protein
MRSANISPAIFIHSSFRTSSTWIWSKFRANPYLPLLRRNGGVDGFQENMTVAKFFPIGGYRGLLSEAEDAYIRLLIANAARLRRTAFFCCKRSLGRTRALKQAIGGVHLVLRRKLLHQWQSYFRQAKGGNPYFFDMILRVIALNEHEPYMAYLGNFIRERYFSCFSFLLVCCDRR